MQPVSKMDYERARHILRHAGPDLDASEKILLNLIETSYICQQQIKDAEFAYAQAVFARRESSEKRVNSKILT